MRDQASELRSLVSGTVAKWTDSVGSPPCMAVLLGARGGVGTTTLSVNTSVALAQLGHRVVLVDAHLGRSDIAPMCRIREQYGVFDLLAARRDIHEVLEPGPLGVQVLPGTWGAADSTELSAYSKQRLVSRLLTLGPYADWIIVDAGNQSGPLLNSLCQAAQTVLLVTSPETISVMDAYATIKTLIRESFAPTLQLVINQSASESVSQDVQSRIATSCERFLRFPVKPATIVPLDEQVGAAAELGVSLMTKAPVSRAARAVELLANALASDYEKGQQAKRSTERFDASKEEQPPQPHSLPREQRASL